MKTKSNFIFVFLLVLVLTIIFLAGCKKSAQEQVEESITTETEEVGKESIGLPAEIIWLFEKSANVKSMQYIYVSSVLVDNDKYKVKGNKIKVELMHMYRFNKTDYYDVVYLDTNEKKAKAYCELDRDCYAIKDREYEVGFAYYYRNTPLDWIEKLKNAKDFVKLNTELIENKQSVHYSFTLENKSGEVWIWEYWGLPLKIILNGKSYAFIGLAVNSLQDSDVVRG
ncbi:MAG: hypothetical protein QW622_01600 [Candidatus Pacearchaeota archaeon]